MVNVSVEQATDTQLVAELYRRHISYVSGDDLAGCHDEAIDLLASYGWTFGDTDSRGVEVDDVLQTLVCIAFIRGLDGPDRTARVD